MKKAIVSKMARGIISALPITLLLLFTLGFSACSKSENGGANAGAEKKKTYTLRFGHAITENDVFHKYMEQWAKAVLDATHGEVIVEIYPSSQLGSEEDVLEQIRQGANMGWQSDFARLGTYVKGLSVVNAPFFVSDNEEALKLSDSAALKELNDELADKQGMANISFTWIQGQRHVFSSKAAKSPAEMRGLLIRTANAPIWVESVNALGCTATPLPYGDIYTGIQTKVVDGCELPYGAANNIKIAEVAKYIIETGHILQLNTMVISKAWLDKLPPEYQKILIDECNKAGRAGSEELARESLKARDSMVAAGMTLFTRDDLDMPAFIKNSAQAYTASGLTELRERIYADIGKRLDS